jgi:hypothetical protein
VLRTIAHNLGTELLLLFVRALDEFYMLHDVKEWIKDRRKQRQLTQLLTEHAREAIIAAPKAWSVQLPEEISSAARKLRAFSTES